MSRILVRQGYDFSRRRTFSVDGVAQDLSAATIKICLKDSTKATELITDTAQTNDGGASWATGVVILRFTAVQTAALATFGDAFIELSVVIAGIRYPYEDIPVVIERGFIAT